MTNALKTRLQKLINAVKDEDITQLWDEFSSRMKMKQRKFTLTFKVGNEVFWQDGTEILRGTIVKVKIIKCQVRQDNADGTLWRIDSILLTKDKKYLTA